MTMLNASKYTPGKMPRSTIIIKRMREGGGAVPKSAGIYHVQKKIIEEGPFGKNSQIKFSGYGRGRLLSGIWTYLADTPIEFAQNIRAMADVVGIEHVCIGTDTKMATPKNANDRFGKNTNQS